MTGSGDNDHGQNEPTQDTAPTSSPTAGAWEGMQPRIASLEAWIAEQSAAHTSSALERSAIESGYTKAEFDEAVRLAGRREQERLVIKPLKWRARVIVLIGYGIIWLLFGTQFLFGPEPYLSTYQVILTISLLVTIAISLVWIRARRPDPERVGRALAILLVVPVVLLVGVAGLCLPFIPVR